MMLNCGADGICQRIPRPKDDIVYKMDSISKPGAHPSESITYARPIEQTLHSDDEVLLMMIHMIYRNQLGERSSNIGVDSD